MSLKLPPNLAMILREVVAARSPALMHALDSSTKLSGEDRESMRQALAAELAATGLAEDDEPNARGKLLEEIINRLGHL